MTYQHNVITLMQHNNISIIYIYIYIHVSYNCLTNHWLKDTDILV